MMNMIKYKALFYCTNDYSPLLKEFLACGYFGKRVLPYTQIEDFLARSRGEEKQLSLRKHGWRSTPQHSLWI